MRLASIFLATVAAAQLEKRCRLGRSIMPCWVRWDHMNCEPYLAAGVELFIDEKHKLMVAYGVCESCFEAIAKEQASAAAGEDTYGNWGVYFGDLHNIGNGTLVINNMRDEGFGFLKGLTPFPHEWGTSCVSPEE